MPTGIALRDARDQLFAAAERVLLRDGANAPTSRAVTTEAGVTKGLLHRHFADFDEFLTQFVLDRIGRIEIQATVLRDAAGTGSVVAHLTRTLTDLFGSIALRIVGLVISRDAVRTRLRERTGGGVPVLRDTTRMISSHLAAEREHGRVAADADIDTLAPTLIGAAHLLFADREGTSPAPADVEKVATTVIADAMT
ncbi:TetR family transcriptional regulator [Streptomyces sp. NPDC052107]|uniref:TetR/AcrR family transcriptional regulator n=1 Tax=Streptomyces sp. NPDC052107 TaxID=3155632 RepID=UPI00341684A2